MSRRASIHFGVRPLLRGSAGRTALVIAAVSAAFGSAPALAQCPGVDDALEPNDSCSTPAVLAVGGYSGLYVETTDRDFYSIDLQAGDLLEIDATFLHADGDIDLYLYDQSSCSQLGSALAWSDSVSDDESIIWGHQGPGSRTMVLEVRIFSGSPGPPCNSYDLELVVTPGLCSGDDSFEPSDSCASPAPISEGIHPNLLVSTTDDDWYRIAVAPGIFGYRAPVRFKRIQQVKIDVPYKIHRPGWVSVGVDEAGKNHFPIQVDDERVIAGSRFSAGDLTNTCIDVQIAVPSLTGFEIKF